MEREIPFENKQTDVEKQRQLTFRTYLGQLDIHSCDRVLLDFETASLGMRTVEYQLYLFCWLLFNTNSLMLHQEGILDGMDTFLVPDA